MGIEKTYFINKNTHNHAKENQYAISISYGSSFSNRIEGYLTNEFQLRTDAKYEPIFNVDGFMESAQKAAAVGGTGLFNTGFWSQLYFKNGGFIILTPEFRIVDWGPSKYASSPTLGAAQFLTSLCLPQSGPGIVDTYAIGSNVRNRADSAINTTTDLFDSNGAVRSRAIERVKSGILKFGEATGEAVKGALSFMDNFSIHDVGSSNPPAVNVEIGEFFSSIRMGMGFFVESVDCKFSKEMTKRGPLYMDVKLELKTQARPKTSGIRAMGEHRATMTDSKNKPVSTNNSVPSQEQFNLKSYTQRLNREAGLP